MRIKDGALRREPYHYRRLCDGCTYFGWQAPSEAVFRQAIQPWLSMTDGALSLRYSPDTGLVLEPRPLDPALARYQSTGFSLVAYPEPFPSDYLGYQGAKTSDRAYYDRAMAFASAQGLPEVLLLDRAGYAVEGYRTNLFAVIEGVLITPDSPLAVRGTMQSALLAQAALAGIPCAVRPLHETELAKATEIFMTNALVECLPVRDYDGKGYVPGEYVAWARRHGEG